MFMLQKLGDRVWDFIRREALLSQDLVVQQYDTKFNPEVC